MSRKYGEFTELTQIAFRKSTRLIDIEPNAQTVGDATIQIPDMAGVSQEMLLALKAQTVTNKTIDADLNTITNIENADIKAGAAIDATKIGGGAVNNTEFSYLDGVTSSIQTQFDSKVTGPASATDNAIARFDGTTGKLVQNASVTIDDSGNAAGLGIDGDVNTVSDLAITALKTVLGDANKVLRRDASGVPQSGNSIPNSSELVTLDATQVLSGKSFSDNTAWTGTGAIDIPAGTTAQRPGSPSSGMIRYNSDLSSFEGYGSAWGSLGGSGGSGGINYIATSPTGIDGNHDAEGNSTTGWVTYDDGATATPVNGVDGAPSFFAWSAQSSNILRGNYSFRAARTGNAQGEGVAYDFKIDSADKGKVLQISFDVDASDSNYTDNDLVVYIYDKDLSTLITPSVVNVKKAKYQFQASFLATTSDDYRLIIHTAVSTSTSWNVDFDNVSVGPVQTVQGVPVGPWINFTPTYVNAPTWTDNNGFYRRVGDSMEINIWATASAAGPGARFEINMPTGFTIDFTKVPKNGGAETTFGHAAVNNGSLRQGTVLLRNASSSSFQLSIDDGTLFDANGFAAGRPFGMNALVPVAEWAGSTVSLDNTRVEYAFNTSTTDANDNTSFGYGPGGNALPSITATTAGATSINKRVRFLNPIQPTDVIKVQIWMESLGTFMDVGNIIRYMPFMSANSESYGIGLQSVNSTDVDVHFGRAGRDASAGFGSAGQSYPESATDRWRVVKCSNPLSIGQTQKLPTEMDDATATALGLKEYLHGTTYNGGNAPTITLSSGGGTLTTVHKGSFIPYQSQANVWHCKFNISVTLSSVSRSGAALAVAGLSISSGYGDGQAISSFSTAGVNHFYSIAEPTILNTAHSTGTTSKYILSGDIELSSKPTWAY